ncbi:MAG TPA: 3-methyl-2-oxobutanoate dehydrogenase subunit VorB [Polyangiaceae bacterium]|jgi:2-oxoglutarate ferredoxin oxidoreductase subunit alpha|nr:MAG: 2-oxoglutarate oxidoreductase subunit KorA [Deltaproteobacteria bacterium ADurb.Bin207]HNZ24598.1 3-methyl-2-oxobutanoate dehydrogenase subunit VorB [Polyangiaceae bacterium]HOD23612.1 3-methyl-2-oxobutanoate dehydrogenase subunit VorB [Polyangiaceae bacterium]HOE50282.1 3-methyl-2-oxobutanoate dehydrogenase subunit VorB [Polyangiaceae bacterium]HOH01035.1 3-methyl-2-oxobutanoate dehydrogenase subunit VorB [Polyangiaceae bacterium]
MAKKLMKGNEAIGEAAIQAGCRNYFAYPITPQSEVAEYLSRRMPEVQGHFVQAESELGAANMVFGAAATGELVFTTSSSPGVSLMSETISYIAGAQLPAVFVNIVRGGPGLGGILPAQSDYFQATKGGGHGDYRLLVLAPATVQEAVDLTMLAFQLAFKYRNPVMILGDGMIGQMMEPVEFKPPPPAADLPSVETWATTGAKGRKCNIAHSLFLDPEALEKNNHVLAAKYKVWQKDEIRFATYNLDNNPRLLIVAYGTMARICSTAIDELKQKGVEVGLIRPITLYPFPAAAILQHAKKIGKVISVEMSMGQMVEDVQAAVGHDIHVGFFGRAGGIIPSPDEVVQALEAELRA